MIYSVFTLSPPNDINDVRFVGVTTQTVKKRHRDIISVSQKDYCHGHDSLLSQWIRELDEKDMEPVLTVVLNTTDKEEATACRISTFNSFFPTGRLLHSFFGKNIGTQMRQRVVNIPGRANDLESKSSKYNLYRKQIELGEI